VFKARLKGVADTESSRTRPDSEKAHSADASPGEKPPKEIPLKLTISFVSDIATCFYRQQWILLADPNPGTQSNH
jgi:hypothetical protein